MGEDKINSERLVRLLAQDGEPTMLNALGVNKLDTFPLLNFFNFLGLKFVLGMIIICALTAITAELILASSSPSSSMMAANFSVLVVLILLFAFIVFVTYKTFIGERFQFMPLTGSIFTILFVTSLIVAVRITLSDNSEFHVVQVVLALVGSLAAGAVFSAFVKVAQRFISA